jgi:hypothetical protein
MNQNVTFTGLSMHKRTGTQGYKMRWGWMMRLFARNSLSNRRKTKRKGGKNTCQKQEMVMYMTAAKVCEEHHTGILGHCVLHTLTPDMYT